MRMPGDRPGDSGKIFSRENKLNKESKVNRDGRQRKKGEPGRGASQATVMDSPVEGKERR